MTEILRMFTLKDGVTQEKDRKRKGRGEESGKSVANALIEALLTGRRKRERGETEKLTGKRGVEK